MQLTEFNAPSTINFIRELDSIKAYFPFDSGIGIPAEPVVELNEVKRNGNCV
jgi:hypothetical protein